MLDSVSTDTANDSTSEYYYSSTPLPFDGMISLSAKYQGKAGYGFINELSKSNNWQHKYISMYLINSLVGTPFLDFGYYDENFIDESGPFDI